MSSAKTGLQHFYSVSSWIKAKPGYHPPKDLPLLKTKYFSPIVPARSCQTEPIFY
jgi:hypothetical protein